MDLEYEMMNVRGGSPQPAAMGGARGSDYPDRSDSEDSYSSDDSRDRGRDRDRERRDRDRERDREYNRRRRKNRQRNRVNRDNRKRKRDDSDVSILGWTIFHSEGGYLISYYKPRCISLSKKNIWLHLVP